MKYLILLIAVLSHFKLCAQPYYFRHYQVENGLSNNTVYCSMQDKNGFMWFGTKDGLCRFDGYRFKTFNISNKEESSLNKDLISALAIDANGVLWIGSQKGLFSFNARQEKFESFLDTLKNVNDILFDKKGQLWLTAGLSIYRYNFQKKKLITFPVEQYFFATSICEQEDGTMWFSTIDGYLQRFDSTTNSFTSFNVFAHSPAATSHWIEKILPDGNGSIFIGTHNQGIKEFTVAASDYKDVLTYNTDKTSIYVRDILQASKNECWFATESGIFIFNRNTGKFINLKKKYLDPYSLSDNAVYTLYKDNEGGVWAGTYFGGLNYFPQQYSSFQKFFPDYTQNSISGSAVREICQDHNRNIWIGTEDAGLNKLNTITKQITHYEPTGEPGSIANSNIHGLLVVKNDLWIGTFEHGLDIMDIATGKVKKHYAAGSGPNDLKSDFIVCLLQTKKGEIFIGSSNGLYRYNFQKDNFTTIDGIADGTFISCLLEDQEGTIWVGTHESGIFFYDPATARKGNLKNEPANKNSLTTNIINAIYQDSYLNLWFATDGGGLCQLTGDKKQFKRYTTKDGFISNFVFKILEDSKKTLWITTSRGLVNLNVSQNKTTVYTKANGLLNDQFNYNSGFKDSSGKLYFGSVIGMIAFNPDAFYQNNFIPPVYITGLQLFNRELDVNEDTSILKQSVIYTDNILLHHNQSSFSIDFAAINFTSPEMTEYSYLTEGLDKEWTYIKSNRKVYFTDLKPGTYTFKVKAAITGNLNTQERKIIIKILPPFWGTAWAYVLYIITGVSLLYYLVRTYHNNIENKKEKEIYKAKFEFFTNLAHEIKTPLTLIKGPVENLSELMTDVPLIKEDVITMERNTNRLVNLVNQILDFQQTETKGFSLDFRNVNIKELLEEAYLTFEPVAKKKKLAYNMYVPYQPIYIQADAEALNKIFSNLFGNAVKYAESKVTIHLLTPAKQDTFLFIEIRNNGFIIPVDMREKIFEPFFRMKETNLQKGSGIGLSIARSLVELHKGDLRMKDNENSMNMFVLSLPYTPYADNKQGITETSIQKI